HFYNAVYGIIFAAMLELVDERKPIDVLTLSARLKKHKDYDRIDLSILPELVNIVPSAANVEHYAYIVKDGATKRSLISAGTVITEMGFDEEKEIKEILDRAESTVFSISQGHITKGFIPIKDTLALSFDRIDE